MPAMTADPDSVRKVPPQTYWKEGAILGGVTAGFFGGLLGYEFADMDETSSSSRIGGMLGGAMICGLMGAIVGGFTGSFIEKK